MPRYAIVVCEDAPAWEGGYESWEHALREDGEEWVYYRAAAHGEVPTLADGLHGVVLTGSRYNTSDKLPWMATLAEYVRQCYVPRGGASADAAARPRIIASCFGAQLAAEALGGDVGSMGTFVLKAEDVVPTLALARLPCAAGIVVEGADGAVSVAAGGGAAAWVCTGDVCVPAAPSTGAASSPTASGALVPAFTLLESHGQHVRMLPPDAVLLASSKSCTNEMFLIGDNVLATQFHAEFDLQKHVMERIWGRVQETGRLTAEQTADALESFKRELHSDAMLRLLRNFLKRRA